MMDGFLPIADARARIARGDCLELVARIPAGSVDMVLCDPPYGNTHAVWDKALDSAALFRHLWRVCKPNAAIALFAQFPFAVDLINAARKFYRYKWVWKKNDANTGFLNAYKMPLRNHEDILIFYEVLPKYNPQFDNREPYDRTTKYVKLHGTSLYGSAKGNFGSKSSDGRRFPLDVIEYSRGVNNEHPTQKPVDLLRYLIRTYTDPGETVLDCTMGSGSTGVAALAEDRRFIGIEIGVEYFDTARRRIEEGARQPRLFAVPAQNARPAPENLSLLEAV